MEQRRRIHVLIIYPKRFKRGDPGRPIDTSPGKRHVTFSPSISILSNPFQALANLSDQPQQLHSLALAAHSSTPQQQEKRIAVADAPSRGARPSVRTETENDQSAIEIGASQAKDGGGTTSPVVNNVKLTPDEVVKVVSKQLRAHTIAQARKPGATRTLIILPVRASAEGQEERIISARVMIDTGATGEFMTQECATKLGGQIIEGNFGAVEEAFGQKTKLNRKLERVKLRFMGSNRRSAVDEEVTTKGDFHVVTKLHPDYDMIVGIKFVEEAGAVIDFGKRPREVTFRQEDGHEVVVKDVLNGQQEEAPGLAEKEVVKSLTEELRREARFRRQVGISVYQFNQMKIAEDQQPLLALKASIEVPDQVMSYEAMLKLKKAEKRLPEAKRSKIYSVYCLEKSQELPQSRPEKGAEAKEEAEEAHTQRRESDSERINALANDLDPAADELERQKLADEIVKKWEGRIMPADLPAGLPPKRDSPQMTIQIKENTNPVAAYARRDTFQHTAESKKMLDDLLAKGFIRPSQSPWGSPMFLVSKPDGTSRMVIDYRALNAATIRNRYPLPRVDELFDKLQGAKYFSKIDLRSGYYQIQMAEEDVQKTAFTSRHGHYEWLVMPMGLTNAPAVFMALMENIFREELDTYVNCFLDDVMIFSKTLEEHRIHVNNVFKKLEEKKLYVKKSKCEFVKTEVEFLGHVVGRDGVKMVEDKVKAIREWKTPECQKEVEQFLGLAGYYRRFIEHFSKIAAPLSELTGTLGKRRKKEEAKGKRERPQVKPFVWGDAQQEAFETLKEAVCTAPVLALPDPNKPFKMQVDASGYATGAVIMQEFDGNWRPIAYLSRRMDKAECNYSVRDQEWLAIIRAMQAWPHYLKGPLGFILESDHQSLRTIQRKDIENGRQARWQQIMGEHEFTIKYIEGPKNMVADALSRGAIGKPPEEDGRESDYDSEEEEEEDNAQAHQIQVALEIPATGIKIKEAALLDPEYQSLLGSSAEELEKLSLSNQGGVLHKKTIRYGPVTVIPQHSGAPNATYAASARHHRWRPCRHGINASLAETTAVVEIYGKGCWPVHQGMQSVSAQQAGHEGQAGTASEHRTHESAVGMYMHGLHRPPPPNTERKRLRPSGDRQGLQVRVLHTHQYEGNRTGSAPTVRALRICRTRFAEIYY